MHNACQISDCAAQYFRYDLKFTSPEVDLLWSKLPVEKDGTVSFEELVQYCFLNFNVTTPGEEAASGEYTDKWQWGYPVYIGHLPVIEKFSIECFKAKTKVVTMAQTILLSRSVLFEIPGSESKSLAWFQISQKLVACRWCIFINAFAL